MEWLEFPAVMCDLDYKLMIFDKCPTCDLIICWTTDCEDIVTCPVCKKSFDFKAKEKYENYIKKHDSIQSIKSRL